MNHSINKTHVGYCIAAFVLVSLLIVSIGLLAGCVPADDNRNASSASNTSPKEEKDTRFLIPDGAQDIAEKAFSTLEPYTKEYYWKDEQNLTLKFVANGYHAKDLGHYCYAFFEVFNGSGDLVGQIIVNMDMKWITAVDGKDSKPFGEHRGMLRNAMKDFSEACPTEENYKISFDYSAPVFVLEDGKTVWVGKDRPAIDIETFRDRVTKATIDKY